MFFLSEFQFFELLLHLCNVTARLNYLSKGWCILARVVLQRLQFLVVLFKRILERLDLFVRNLRLNSLNLLSQRGNDLYRLLLLIEYGVAFAGANAHCIFKVFDACVVMLFAEVFEFLQLDYSELLG